jgi:hypothetical protein
MASDGNTVSNIYNTYIVFIFRTSQTSFSSCHFPHHRDEFKRGTAVLLFLSPFLSHGPCHPRKQLLQLVRNVVLYYKTTIAALQQEPYLNLTVVEERRCMTTTIR